MRLLEWGDLDQPHAFLSSLLRCTDRYVMHPGDLSWWVHHHDPRTPRFEVWMDDDDALVVIHPSEPAIDVVIRPGTGPVGDVIEWAQGRVGGRAKVAGVADTDTEMNLYLDESGYGVVSSFRSYRWDLLSHAVPTPSLGEGWLLRPLGGEEEADNRRRASHAAFASDMDPEQHLERYLGFMRSPVYLPENDLVAVAPDGTIAAFMVWWPDTTGVAQLEPFGTHPDFHRRGVGRALLHYGLSRMRDAGMTVCRVVTDDYREANAFYVASGFDDIGALRWWEKTR
jgi:GNAT superfamily N-acetyltransferase